jgi:hypothetical protein
MRLGKLPRKARERLIATGYSDMTPEERLDSHKAALAELAALLRCGDTAAFRALRRARGHER